MQKVTKIDAPLTRAQQIWQAALRGSATKKTPAQKTLALTGKAALEAELALQLRALGVPFQEHQRFHPDRRWEADFILWDEKIIVEVDGGIWEHRSGKTFIGKDGLEHEVQSRHANPVGYRNDCRKLNAAALLGFLVVRGTSDMVHSGELAEDVCRAYYNFHGDDAFISRKLARLAAPANVIPFYQGGPDIA